MKYTVHRALAMLKTTKARIGKELASEDAFIQVARGQEDNIRGVAVKDIERDIQGRYDRITALINNYIKVKAAVVKSNAGILPDSELHTVPIMGQPLTVAEIIDLNEMVYGNGRTGKNKTLGFKPQFLAKLKRDYVEAQQEFDEMQERTDNEISQYIKTVFDKKKDGDDTDAAVKDIIEATTKALRDKKAPRFVDPLKIADKISKLENEIETFNVEADSALSEQNALTTIDIELTEIQ